MLNVPERQSLIEAPDLFSTGSSSLNAALETDLTIGSLPESSTRAARLIEETYSQRFNFDPFVEYYKNFHDFTLPTIAGDLVNVLWSFNPRRRGTTFSIFSDSLSSGKKFPKVRIKRNEGTYQYIDLIDGEQIKTKIAPRGTGAVEVSIAKRGNIVARPLNLNDINNGFITWGYNVQSNRSDQSFTLPPGSTAIAKLAYVDEAGRLIQLLDQRPVEFRNEINTSFTTPVPANTPDGSAFIKVFIEKTGPFAETTEQDNAVAVRNPLGKPNLKIVDPRFLPGGGIEYGFNVEGNYVEAAPGKQIKIRLIWVDEGGNWIKEADSKLYAPKLPKDSDPRIQIERNILEGKPFEAKGLVAFVDSEQAVTETTDDDNATTFLSPFLWDTPKIMRNKGWQTASRLLQNWLNKKGQVTKGGLDFSLDVDTDSIKFDWLLSPSTDSQGRTQTAYTFLLQTALERNRGLETLRQKVARWFKDNPSEDSLSFREIWNSYAKEPFKYRNRTEALINWSSQRVLVAPRLEQSAGLWWELDESFAALGNFSLYSTPLFTARRSGRNVTITITGMKVYAFDSFDADGKQYLGNWQKPNSVRVKTTSLINNSLPGEEIPNERTSTGEYILNNATLRQYRADTGLGGDYLIRSDVKDVSLNEANQNSPLTLSFTL